MLPYMTFAYIDRNSPAG